MPDVVDSWNAAEYLVDRQVEAGAGGSLALTGVAGDVTYTELLERVQRAAGGLRSLGLLPEQRLLLFMADSPDLVVLYLAAMRIGAVPVPVSTMLRADDLAELLRDSRARVLAVSAGFAADGAAAAAHAPELSRVLAGSDIDADVP